MSDIVKSIILGIVQGLTEFLPISSSGHLAIMHKYLNFDVEQMGLFFDIVLHLATLLAVIIFYRSTIKDLAVAGIYSTKSLIQGRGIKNSFFASEHTRLLSFIVIGSIPTGIIGILFKDTVEHLSENLIYVGIALLFTSLMLMFFELKRKTYKNIDTMKISDSLIIGIMQGIAVIPGISRSGSTISIAKILNIDKASAAKYSFLLSIPAITGAFLLKLKDIDLAAIMQDQNILIAGFAASFISGYLSLRLLIWLIAKANLKFFMIYCAVVGILLITTT